MKNFLRLPFGLVIGYDRGQALLSAGMLFDTNLRATHIRDGKVLKEYNLGSGTVTTEGVTYMAADMAGGASDINLFLYHDSGTGTTASAIGDTDLQTPAGPTTRATGSQSASTNTYTTVGTIAYTGTLAITEWGLFTTASRATTVIWDHKVFSAINVVSGDSIQFTYVLTITAGG